MSEFGEVLDGTVVSRKFQIVMQENAILVVSAPCKILSSLHDKFRNKLEALHATKIIGNIIQHTVWVSPIVMFTNKNGDKRICLAPKSFNDNMCCSQYHLPTIIGTVPSKLSNANYFSILYTNAGFCMFLLDKQSSDKSTFSNSFWLV